MSARSKSGFALDRSNAKLFGVCAGFARWTGWNPMVVRLGLVAATIFVFGPIAILAYLVTAWAAS